MKKKLAKRPLLKDMKKATTLFNERVPIYKEKADIIISVENESLENVVKKILNQVK